MKKEVEMYFRNVDSNFCETLEDIISDAKFDGLTQVTVIEAIPDNGTSDMIWCTHEGEANERSECKKSVCPYYESTSGRGVCKHRGQLYLYGEEKTFDLEEAEIKANDLVFTSETLGSNCIIIGDNLSSNKDYHLLVDRNGVKIDRIMTIEEHALLSEVLKSVIGLKFH